MIDAAAGALGVGHARAARRPLVPAALRGRGRLLVAGGLLLLTAAIAAAVVALTTGEEARVEPLGTGVAAIDPATGEVGSLTESKTLPGNVAVGEGAVWVLTDGEDTVSRIDPQTKEIAGAVETPGTPSQLAAGEGALWVGKSGGRFVNTTVGISRVDPRTNRVLVERIDVAAATVAAGKEGVWFVPWDRPSVKRIDPRTNRVVQTIPIGSNSLPAIAVGAGSVWATAESEGLIHRIVPGERPTTRTIDVGVGVSYVAFGHGAVWTANYIDGTVSRIDPRTNDVTATVSAGSPQALAVGEGSAWVSVVGAGREGALPAFACGEVVTGRGRPDVLIASDLPLRGPQSAGPRAMAEAIRFVLERRGFKAGKHSVGYASCDDSTSQSGSFELRRCAANANAYAHARQLVAVIGPYNSGCAIVEIPILNRAPGGPLAAISPSNTHPGLTRARSSDVPPFIRGQPQVFYPTGIRSYVRVAPRDDLQGAASVVLAKELGLGSLYLLHGGGYWGALLPDAFGRAAREVGVRIAGSEAFDPDAETYASLADRVARSGAQGVVLGARVSRGGDRVLKALRVRLGPRVPIIASDGFSPISDVLGLAGRAAEGLYVTITDVPATGRLVRELGPTASAGFIVQAAQATEVVLGAIARSDGSRSSVLEQLRATRVRNGPLGTFRFDPNGDITPAKLTVVRVTPEAPPDPRLPAFYRGATVDRVLQVPSDFAG